MVNCANLPFWNCNLDICSRRDALLTGLSTTDVNYLFAFLWNWTIIVVNSHDWFVFRLQRYCPKKESVLRYFLSWKNICRLQFINMISSFVNMPSIVPYIWQIFVDRWPTFDQLGHLTVLLSMHLQGKPIGWWLLKKDSPNMVSELRYGSLYSPLSLSGILTCVLCSMSVVQECFEYLDAPVERIAGADVPMP
jgi:hypothetical protein